MLEEIENDLHPAALRSLISLVERSVSRGNQIVISTHSNVVVRYLGSLPDARVFRVDRVTEKKTPTSQVRLASDSSEERRSLLQSLGYELMDFDLYSAWLILEEASAEHIIREFVIPWFAPKLCGRMRTVAAQGAADVAPRFIDLVRLFTFIHLEPIYRNTAWVLTDGDEEGKKAVEGLKEKFPTWPSGHFLQLSASSFENYFPAEFSEKARSVLSVEDRARRRELKEDLRAEVVAWLRADDSRGRSALAVSAGEVIAIVRQIENVVLSGRS